MAEAGISLDQNQFTCPVCLYLLNDPVTTPCGHNFCKVCINSFWDQEDVKRVYSCPQCRETFTPRPDLRRNNMLVEVVEKLRKTELQAASSVHGSAGPGDVECDFCISRKRKAVKSCLVCLASYCEDHLLPHFQSPAFKKHKLVEACAELQEKICTEHEKHQGHNPGSLQLSFPSVCVSPGCEDSSIFTGNQQLSFDEVKESLLEISPQEKISPQASVQTLTAPVEPKSREDFLQYFCCLTLDPNTAHRKIILSEESRTATHSRTEQRVSSHPERFDSRMQVLCKESVCGRCYWEVEWSGGVSMSVSYTTISRKGEGNRCAFGYNSQSWSLQCSSSSLSFWHDDIKTKLRVPASSRIGVYVDHRAGTLSFYSVSDTMTLLHRVQTTFTQPLYAGFRMWYDSAVSLCDLNSNANKKVE